MIDEHMQEQASLYALGALEPAAASAFEATARANPELAQLVRELRSVAEAVAGETAALEAPAGVKARLLLELERAPRAVTRAPLGGALPHWIPWTVAASLALLSLAFFWQASELRTQIAGQARRIDELTMSEALARSQTEDLRNTVASLRNSNRLANVRIALLSSLLATAPKTLAVSVWDNEQQSGVFLVRNLKPAPDNKDYQLWIIDPRYASPVDAGVFRVDAAGNGRAQFKAKMPIQMANQFAVTLERRGGADVPDTKAMVLAGS